MSDDELRLKCLERSCDIIKDLLPVYSQDVSLEMILKNSQAIYDFVTAQSERLKHLRELADTHDHGTPYKRYDSNISISTTFLTGALKTRNQHI